MQHDLNDEERTPNESAGQIQGGQAAAAHNKGTDFGSDDPSNEDVIDESRSVDPLAVICQQMSSFGGHVPASTLYNISSLTSIFDTTKASANERIYQRGSTLTTPQRPFGTTLRRSIAY